MRRGVRWCRPWYVHVSKVQMEQGDDSLHSIFSDICSQRQRALGNGEICLREITEER